MVDDAADIPSRDVDPILAELESDEDEEENPKNVLPDVVLGVVTDDVVRQDS